MKKTPAPVKPDAATYFIAKRMERAGMLRPGQALTLAATVSPQKNAKVTKRSKGKRP